MSKANGQKICFKNFLKTRKHKKPKVLLCAGGTGGHVFPALIIARKLSLRKDLDIEVMVDQRGQRYLGDWKGPVWPIHVYQGHWSFRLLSVFYEAVKTAWRFFCQPPTLVIGFGGYPAASGTLAAFMVGIPFMIQEQNSVLGRVNRWMAPWAVKVFLSFSKTLKGEKIHAQKKVLLSCPLVREEFMTSPLKSLPVLEAFARKTPLRLLVLGGSQGSKALALLIQQMTVFLDSAQCARLFISLQAPEFVLKECTIAFEKAKITYETAPFFKSLPLLMRQSHLVMARSGASTVAEITLMGVPSLLIPLPHSASNHQIYNCQSLVDAHQAWMWEEKDTTPKRLADFIGSLLKDPSILQKKRDSFQKGSLGAPIKDPSDVLISEVDSFLKGLHKE